MSDGLHFRWKAGLERGGEALEGFGERGALAPRQTNGAPGRWRLERPGFDHFLAGARTGIDSHYLEDQLESMSRKGLVFRVKRGETTLFRAAPFMIGLYEYSVNLMDRELAAPVRSWEALHRGIASFVTAYPAVLLQAPPAILVLGRACVQGSQQAPGAVWRTRFGTRNVALPAPPAPPVPPAPPIEIESGRTGIA